MKYEKCIERRAEIKRLMDAGIEIDFYVKRDLAIRFKVTIIMIYKDLFHMYIVNRDKSTCQYCGQVKPENYALEHVIPEHWGGHTEHFNLVYACQRCNGKKSRSIWIPNNMHVLEQENYEWAQNIRKMYQRVKNGEDPALVRQSLNLSSFRRR